MYIFHSVTHIILIKLIDMAEKIQSEKLCTKECVHKRIAQESPQPREESSGTPFKQLRQESSGPDQQVTKIISV